MHPVVRSLAVAALAAVSISCADQGVGLRRGGLARLPIAPVFATSASGGPKIDVETIKGVLRRTGSLDSALAEARVQGDSAILEFENVTVTGEETKYNLGIKALDANGVVVFEGTQEVTIKPGDNAPAAPTLNYTAPDATVTAIDIRDGSTSVTTLELEWAGAKPNDVSCLSRAPNSSARTSAQLSVAGTNAASQAVANVRVGWTSSDESVAIVDDNGLVTARCSNKSATITAKTFLDVVDQITVNVTAPPFTLLMNPETANVPRGSTLQLNAVVVDENGNATSASVADWTSSDTERATVSATGLVTGISNGRVVITASSGDRSTVGIIQVVRPNANRVAVNPDDVVIAQGQSRFLAATAFDSGDQQIPDASGFTFTSTNTGVVTATGSGTIRGVGAGTAMVIVALDGKADTAMVSVTASTTGRVAGRVVDAANNNSAVASADVTSSASPTATGIDGRFESPELPPSGSSITVSKTGYTSFTYFNLPILLGQTVELGDLPMAPAGGNGTLTGTVVNALNDAAVGGATVKLFQGINSTATDPNSGSSVGLVATATTAANGTFTMSSVPAGTYMYSVTATGFSFTRLIAVSVGSQTRDTRIALSPTVTSGGLRIVLTWGACANANVPCDLDSHLTGPTSPPDPEGRFHVAYFNPLYFNSPDEVAKLDNDAVSGLGPETSTLRQKAAGVYKFYVHNYSDGFDQASTRLSTTSQARVDVYQGTNLIATFLPPTGQPGTIWTVFFVEGTTITPVNQMLVINDFSEVPADFMRIGAPDEADARRLVSDLKRHRLKQR